MEFCRLSLDELSQSAICERRHGANSDQLDHRQQPHDNLHNLTEKSPDPEWRFHPAPKRPAHRDQSGETGEPSGRQPTGPPEPLERSKLPSELRCRWLQSGYPKALLPKSETVSEQEGSEASDTPQEFNLLHVGTRGYLTFLKHFSSIEFEFTAEGV